MRTKQLHSTDFLIKNLKIKTILTIAILLTVVSFICISMNNQSTSIERNLFVEDLGHSDLDHSYQSVFFLKVHKTASSTIQNVLMRYGNDKDLNFVLPYATNNFGFPEPFHPSMALPLSKPTDAYNIFCHHARFDQFNVEGIMPEGTIFVTMLRDPVKLFESLYSYYDLGSHYMMTLEELVKRPQWWLNTCNRYLGIIGMNQMAFDLGWDSDVRFVDRPKIESFLDGLERRFDLVMITEHFQESLVLLKHLMNLTDQQVVCFHHNSRKATNKQNLTQELEDSIKKANHMDQLIYTHFLNIFHNKVDRFGSDRMRQEVNRLNELTEYWIRECGARRVSNDQADFQYRQYSGQVHSIQLKKSANQFCQNLAKAEIPFTRELRLKHLNRHANWWLQFLYKVGYYHV